MDKAVRMLEKIGRVACPAKFVDVDPPREVRERLLADHVTESRYVFLNLAATHGAGWELALAGREECGRDYVVDRARYPFHVIEHVTEGSGVAQLGGGPEHVLQPGTVFVYSPRTACRMRVTGPLPMVKFFFALAGRGVERRLADVGLASGVVRRLAPPSALTSIAEEIIHEGGRHGRHTSTICLKLLEVFLLKIAESVEDTSARNERGRENYLRCKALIESNADRLQSLGEIAAAVRMDGASICRLFRRFHGTSPYRYLLRRKMTIAAEYLLDSGALVKEAAERVGFADPYHFARCFRAVHGVPPSRMRGIAGRAGRE